MTSSQAQADVVRAAITSASTCTTATVTLLTQLLSPDTTLQNGPSNTTTKAPSKAPLKGQPRTIRGINAGSTAAKPQKNGKPSEAGLSAKEKAILATEVVNATLKVLSSPTKAPPPVRRQPSSTEIKSSPRCTALRRSSSAPQSPLQPRSLNRVSSSPTMEARYRRSSSSASITAPNYRPVAECARIAFACMLSLQNSKTPCMMDMPPLQLENGMSALVGKLISLGLDDLAMRELRILKNRLDGVLRTSGKQSLKKNGKPGSTQNSSANPANGTLVELLDFEVVPTGSVLALAIATQFQVLKLISSSKKPSVIAAALPKLDTEYEFATSRLILRSAEESQTNASKAARQLETLSQLLLSLCPNISISEDEIALTPKLSTSPEVSFDLQTLGLRCRLLWWKLSEHKGDLEIDVVRPFSRCLAAFARRSQSNVRETYKHASQAFQQIQNAAATYPSSPIKGSKSPTSSIHRVLGSLAQDAGYFDEAVRWLKLLQDNYGETSVSEVQSCSIAASLAALKLLTSPTSPEIEELLLTVLGGLDGPLKGESLELDELLSEISKLRRTAVAVLYRRDPESNGGTKDTVPDGTRQMCESLILICPRFLNRYLGKRPEMNAAAKSIVRHEQRRQVVTKSAYHAIDSAVFLIKKFQSEKRLTWDLMDSTLQDCLKLLEGIIDPPAEASDDSTAASTSYFVKMSHLYFTQHLNMRRDAEGPKDIQHLRALRRSIDCVRSRSSDEKRAALFNTKLERLADIYRMLGRQDEARETLVSLHSELLESRILSVVATAGSSKPAREVWAESEDTSTFARAIGLLAKLELRSGSKLLCPPLYDANWPAVERGMVLEHLLDILSKGTTESQIAQRSVILELLTVYDPHKFPIRRLRVVIRILQLDIEQRRDLMEDVKNALAIANLQTVIDHSDDLGLVPYLPHLQAFASSALEIQEDHPRVDLFKPHLALWCSIIEENKDHKALTSRIGDISELLNHLSSIADFLHMKGIANVRVGILRMIANISEIASSDSCPDDLVICYISLGLQYLELGYSGKAGLAFDRAHSYASCNGVSPEALLRMHLSYGEYALAIGNSEKCEENLLRVNRIVTRNSDISAFSKSLGPLSRKIGLAGLVADAYLVHSILALEKGASEKALAHAKRSVRLTRYSWVKTTMQMKSKPTKLEGSSVESLADEVLNMSISTAITPAAITVSEQLPGPAAWALVHPLFRSLSHLSRVYAHHGMFQETLYYAEQAYKLVKLVDSAVHVATALAATGNTWLGAGKLNKASEVLVKAKQVSMSSGDSQTMVMVNAYVGRLHKQLGDHTAELTAYELANTTLETLSNVKYINDIERINDSAAMLEEEMSRLTLKASKIKEPRKAAPVKRATTKKGAEPPKPATEIQPSISDQCTQLASLKGLILRDKASVFMLLKKYAEAEAVLKEADKHTHKQTDMIDQHMAAARRLLLQSINQMSSDPVYSVLQDSTISYPAIVAPSRGALSASDKSAGVRLSPARRTQATQSTRNRRRSKSPSPVASFDTLRLALDHLIEARSAAVRASSTAVISSLSSLLSTISTLLSAAGPILGKTVAHPAYATCCVELSRNIALNRERKAAISDLGSSQQVDDFQWPTPLFPDSEQSSGSQIFDISRFQKDYVDIIPQGWTAISISLSDSRQELYLTKMQSGQSPFMLRLPLGRNNSRDVDEEVFDFAQGKSELLEIIELANTSAHSAKDLTGRVAKTAWWTKREELDMRLKELLDNIETVWLGGFRGIFSQHRPRPDLLARFQKSFQNILDKHLPSRQTTAKKAKINRITLDTRVLELFIGLGNPDDGDLDEALTDLLYFVVDILQFHGERNAYDEIDFDSIVIETNDALRSYHAAVLAASTNNEHNHTILVLDKALHAFPWESLPCMDGLAVSRLPSLSCLRDRLLQQQAASSANISERHYVDRENGAYILNPGGDLKTTQATFEPSLQALNTWDGIVKREPTEAEIRDNLESKDILLYFGHGSGAQYIRSKAIKRLSKCAVTILMGCSSGALTEAGEFEPYGPPIDYMLAGCPALVATLWDVTDKDIDRFAKSTFEHWGIFKPQAVQKEAPVKARGKKSAVVTPKNVEEMSLVKAVAEGRKACNFRYLTAAAVCVYGIPVYLK